MQETDSVRRNGYVVALVLGLIAMFVLMLGNGWTATLLGLAAVAVVAVVLVGFRLSPVFRRWRAKIGG